MAQRAGRVPHVGLARGRRPRRPAGVRRLRAVDRPGAHGDRHAAGLPAVVRRARRLRLPAQDPQGHRPRRRPSRPGPVRRRPRRRRARGVPAAPRRRHRDPRGRHLGPGRRLQHLQQPAAGALVAAAVERLGHPRAAQQRRLRPDGQGHRLRAGPHRRAVGALRPAGPARRRGAAGLLGEQARGAEAHVPRAGGRHPRRAEEPAVPLGTLRPAPVHRPDGRRHPRRAGAGERRRADAVDLRGELRDERAGGAVQPARLLGPDGEQRRPGLPQPRAACRQPGDRAALPRPPRRRWSQPSTDVRCCRRSRRASIGALR